MIFYQHLITYKTVFFFSKDSGEFTRYLVILKWEKRLLHCPQLCKNYHKLDNPDGASPGIERVSGMSGASDRT